jgi:hypothetical protein
MTLLTRRILLRTVAEGSIAMILIAMINSSLSVPWSGNCVGDDAEDEE